MLFFFFLFFNNSLKGSKKDEQYKLLWAELTHILQIGPQSPNHKKLLSFIKNESSAEKIEKRLTSQMTSSPMSPPGSSDLSKKKTQHLLLSSSNRYKILLFVSPISREFFFLNKKIFSFYFRSLYDIQVAADRALSRKRLDFAGRLCTPHGKIAKLYPNLKVNEGVYQDCDNPQFAM